MTWLRSLLFRRVSAKPSKTSRNRGLTVEGLEDRLVPAGNLLATVAGPYPTHLFREYTPTGTLVRSVTVPPTPGSSFDYARDLVEDPSGMVYVYNGTFTPYLAAYNPTTSSWTQSTYAGWSTVSNISYGGLAEYQNYLYATDMATAGGMANGVVRFNLADGSATRFGNVDFTDLNIGLDGKLYALSGSTSTVYVYDPIGMGLLRTVTLPSADYRGVAANANGDIFTAAWNNVISHFNSSGALRSSITLNSSTGAPFMYNFSDDIDIASDGTLAIGSFSGYIAQMTSNFTNISYINTGTNNQVFVTFAPQPPATQPSISVSNTSVVEGNAGANGPMAQFTVSLSAPSSQTVQVNYVTADGTATAPSDYTAVSGTVSFAPGTTSQVVSVPIYGDTIYEGNENFSLNLSQPVNATLGTALATCTIVDDDSPPSISANSVTVTSPTSGYVWANVPVTLSNAASVPITVTYNTADGTAAAGVDYQGVTNGTLTIPAGVTSTTIPIQVYADPYWDPSETFTLTLSNPSLGTIANPQGTATINSSLPPPTISVNNVTVTNVTSGTTPATFTISLSEPLSDPTSIDYATADGNATAGTDYQATSGTVTFAPGQTSQTVTVTVIGDSLYDANEFFYLNLMPAAGGYPFATGEGMIVSGVPEPSFSVNDATVQNTASGTTATFTVTLSAVSEETATVYYSTRDGSASQGTDYQLASGTLTFAPGQTSQTVTVNVTGDPYYDSTETFYLDLFTPTNATLDRSEGTGTILSTIPEPSVSISGVTVTEGNQGTTQANFAVMLSAPCSDTVMVNYATSDGTATAYSDYQAASSYLSFSPGQTTLYVSVAVFGDKYVEPDETFFVTLSNPVGVTLGQSQATGTILNDDHAPVVSPGPDQTVNEGATVQFDASGSSDADGDLLSYTWDFGDNSYGNGSGATPTHVYTDNGVYKVTVSVSDGYNVTTGTLTVTVLNVAPTASVGGPADAVPGQDQTFSFSASDPSSADQAAPFTYQITWGDGSTQTVQGPGSGVWVDHVFTSIGSFPVTVTATDKDGGTGPAASHTVAVVAAELQGPDLYVGGTTGDDTITIQPADANGTVDVVINGQDQGTFVPSGQVVVYGQAGNDVIQVVPLNVNGNTTLLDVPAVLFGGDGDDTLDARGAAGATVLVGGAGSDTLYGGSGRNILIGGTGSDVLHGGTDDDVVIGGSTSFDASLSALIALRAEWARTDADYLTRIAHLNGTQTGGLNGTYLLTTQTVTDDGAGNDLYGNLGQDWFFAANSDRLHDVESGETVTTL